MKFLLCSLTALALLNPVPAENVQVILYDHPIEMPTPKDETPFEMPLLFSVTDDKHESFGTAAANFVKLLSQSLQIGG